MDNIYLYLRKLGPGMNLREIILYRVKGRTFVFAKLNIRFVLLEN
jgi:hypothetical protein